MSLINVNSSPIVNIVNPYKISINNVTIIPYTSASISVCIYYNEPNENIFSEREKLKTINIFMSTSDYLLWQNDDSYLITYVLNALGFTKAN